MAKTKKRHEGRFSWLAAAAIAGAVGATTLLTRDLRNQPIEDRLAQVPNYNEMPKPSEVPREERQKYLDSLLENVPNLRMEFCEGIRYDHDGSEIRSYFEDQLAMIWQSRPGLASKFEDKETWIEEQIGGMKEWHDGLSISMVPDIVELSGMRRNTSIYVNQNLFESRRYHDYSAADVAHHLVAHAYRYVVQHAIGLPFGPLDDIKEGLHTGELREDIYRSLSRIDAVYHELKGIERHREHFTRDYFMHTLAGYMQQEFYLKTQIESGPASELESELIDEALKRCAVNIMFMEKDERSKDNIPPLAFKLQDDVANL